MKRVVPLDLRHKIALAINLRQEKQIIKESPLRQLFWECTLRCNLKCRHCGSDCRKEADSRDMPLADFIKVAKEIADAPENNPNKILIILTGGEALMRQDLEQCGKELYNLGFPWGMVTNGFSLTQNRLNSLIDSGLRSITISLDGLEQEHDWMRGVKGSFARASQAIKMLAHTDLSYDVVTCVNKKTIGQLDELKEYLISLGLKSWRLFTVFPVGRAAEDELLTLSSSELHTLLNFIKDSRKEGRIKTNFCCEGFLGNYEGEVRDSFYACRAGVTVGSILVDGSISACASIRSNYKQGNIYQDSFMDVWRKGYTLFRDREWMRTGDCAKCKYFDHCRGNAMHLRDNNGKLLLCHIKKLNTN